MFCLILTTLSIFKFAMRIIFRFVLCLFRFSRMLQLSTIHKSSYFTTKLNIYKKGKNVILKITGNRKVFKFSIVKKSLLLVMVLYSEKKKMNTEKPPIINFIIFSTCLYFSSYEAYTCIIENQTKIGNIIISVIKLNVKKFTKYSIITVHLITSINSFLKSEFLLRSFTLNIVTQPNPNIQNAVSFNKDMCQRFTLCSTKT